MVIFPRSKNVTVTAPESALVVTRTLAGRTPLLAVESRTSISYVLAAGSGADPTLATNGEALSAGATQFSAGAGRRAWRTYTPATGSQAPRLADMLRNTMR